MIAFKGFKKGLTCRGYRFEPGVTAREKAANCVKNGFHAAEDPLDMLTYYPRMKESEYWIVKLGGDMHEDGSDSKIAATELTPIRRLTVREIVAAALLYIKNHPGRKGKEGKYEHEKIKIAWGKNPVLSGEKGQTLGFAVNCNGEFELGLFTIDGRRYLPGTKYDWKGNRYEGI